MVNIIVDFEKEYIGAIAYQGESNKSALLFDIPSSFVDYDFVNAEFEIPDETKVVKSNLHPINNLLSVPITQDITAKVGVVSIQLVCYDSENFVIAKSPVILSHVQDSVDGREIPSAIEQAIEMAHWHDNKELLDTITPEMLVSERADWNENDPTEKSYVNNRTHWVEYGNTEDVSYVWNNSTGAWDYNGDNNSDNYAYNLIDGGTYKITLQGIEYTFVAGVTKQITDGTYMGFDHVTMTRIAIGNMKMAAVEDLRNAPSAYESGDFKMCFTYEIVTIGNDTTEKSEIGTVISTGYDSEADADTVSFTITPITYHKLNSDYLSDEVNDAALKKHWHDNKQEIDKIGVAKTHGGSYGFDIVTYNNSPISQYSLWTLSSDGNGVVEGSLYAGDITTVLAVFGEPIVSITITELMNPLHMISEYNLHFTSGSAAPTVALPASVQWVVEPTFEPNKHYQISIVDNIALWCAVDVDVEVEE